ncbi:MAG: hypothetical protein ACFFAH_16700 [Promethearchaeota archaeon]
MAKIIQDLWILTQTGTVVFKRVFNSKVNAQLFGGLMSALNSFANELASGGLTNFELSSIRFTILKSNDFLFVSNASKKIKEKRIHEELRKIAQKFFDKYSLGFFKSEWDGDVNIFDEFEKEIESALEDPVKKFWSGMA